MAPRGLVARGENILNAVSALQASGVIRSVSISPDGKWLATGSTDKSARIWDLATGIEAFRFSGHDGTVSCVAFSPDGQHLATGSTDKSIRVWNLDSGAEVFRKKHGGTVLSVEFSRDGKLLVSGSADHTARIWEVPKGTLVRTLDVPGKSVKDVTFSSDAKRLATGSDDKTARLWDLATGKELSKLEGHSGPVNAVAFSPDGTRIATGSSDGTARIWYLAQAPIVLGQEGQGNSVNDIAFSPDGTRLATGSGDRTARIWDVAEARELIQLRGHRDKVFGVAFFPDGARLATGSTDRTARVWDLTTGKELLLLEGHGSSVASSAFSPDGKTLATASADGVTRIWDLTTNTLSSQLKTNGVGVRRVAYSPNGRLLATGSEDGAVRIWDLAGGPEPRLLNENVGPVFCLAFSPNSQRLAIGSASSTVRIWDLAAAARPELRQLPGHGLPVLSVAFSPDGRFLATGSADATARIWNLDTMEAHVLRVADSVTSVAFAGDGARLAAGFKDGTVRIWEVSTSKEVLRLEEGQKSVTSLAFFQDGTRLATGSSGGTGRIWDLATRTPLFSLTAIKATLNNIALSNDQKRLATSSDDGTVRIWGTDPGSNLALFYGGSRDLWVGCNVPRKLCQRWDDGSVVTLRAGARISALSPPQAGTPPDLRLTRDGEPTLNRETGWIEVPYRVQNRGGDAYWVRLTATAPPATDLAGGPPTVIPVPPPLIFRLAGDSPQKLRLLFAPILAQRNPRGDRVEVKVRLSHAHSQESTVEKLEVPVDAAELAMVSVTLPTATDASITVKLRNLGVLETPRLTGALTLVLDGTEILLPSTVITPTLPAGETRALAFSVPSDALEKLRRAKDEPSARLALTTVANRTSGRPYDWSLEPPPASPSRWPVALAWIAAFFILTASGYLGVQLHPLVAKLVAQPSALLTVPPANLRKARLLLLLSGRLEVVREAAGVSERRLDLARNFLRLDTEDRIARLAERLEVRLTPLTVPAPAESLRSWLADTPERLLLNLPQIRVVVAEEGLDPEEVLARLQELHQHGDRLTLLLDFDEVRQQSLRQQVRDRGLFAVVPSASDLTPILLERDPLPTFCKIISGQVAATRISVYQLGLGVSHAAAFFGREAELTYILNREPANYLLVGGRQVGKSSLLKELQRRIKRRGNDAIYLVLSGSDLGGQLAEALGCGRSEIDAALRRRLAGRKTPIFVLIDEADLFVAEDLATGQRLLGLLRKLSEERVACFVLTGFWQLYRAASRDYLSVLKNFGEQLQVGALDPLAAQRLVTEPMAALGLHYSDSALVQHILAQTGRRANLLVLTCAELIRKLSAEDREVKLEAVKTALRSDRVASALASWGRLSGGQEPEADTLDSLVVQAVAAQRAATLKELQQLVVGHLVTSDALAESILRLKLAYVLIQDGSGPLQIASPILAEQLRDLDLDEAITQQLRALPSS